MTKVAHRYDRYFVHDAFVTIYRKSDAKKLSKVARVATPLSIAIGPRVKPLASKLHTKMRDVAASLASKAGGRKASKLAKGLTPSQAVSHLRDDYGIRVTGEMTDAACEVITAVASTLDELVACGNPIEKAIKSSRLLDVILDPGTHINEPDPDNPTICYHSKAFADYEVDSASIRIATGLGMDEPHDHPLVGVGEHNIGKGFRSVLTHELGHAFMQDCEDAAREKFQITYEKQPKEYWEKTVSEYAGTSDRELFAESFSAYTHRGYQDNLPSEVLDFFERAGLKSNVRKLAKSAEDDLVAEFDDLFDSLDWTDVEESMLDDLREAFIEAAKAEFKATSFGADTDQLNQGAIDYAKDRAAEAIKDISETTRNSIREDIVGALEEGMTSQELMGDLIDSYSFSPDRAERIARTELATANVQGHVVASQDAGATGKIWLLSNDHDDGANCNCTDNAEEGEIPFDEDWSSGDDWPPAHPNCMCDWAAVYPDDGADADTEKFEKAVREGLIRP